MFVVYPLGGYGDMLFYFCDLLGRSIGSEFLVLVLTVVEFGFEIVFHFINHSHSYV